MVVLSMLSELLSRSTQFAHWIPGTTSVTFSSAAVQATSGNKANDNPKAVSRRNMTWFLCKLVVAGRLRPAKRLNTLASMIPLPCEAARRELGSDMRDQIIDAVVVRQVKQNGCGNIDQKDGGNGYRNHRPDQGRHQPSPIALQTIRKNIHQQQR